MDIILKAWVEIKKHTRRDKKTQTPLGNNMHDLCLNNFNEYRLIGYFYLKHLYTYKIWHQRCAYWTLTNIPFN